MSITEALTPTDLLTANAKLALRVADLDSRLTAETARADRETTRADGLYAREEKLEAELRTANANTDMYERISLQLQNALDDKHMELRRVSEMFAEQFTANGELRTELANRPARRLLRRHIR